MKGFDHITGRVFLPVFPGVQALFSEEPWKLVAISAKKVEHPTKLPLVTTTSYRKRWKPTRATATHGTGIVAV